MSTRVRGNFSLKYVKRNTNLANARNTFSKCKKYIFNDFTFLETNLLFIDFIVAFHI